MAAWTEWSAGLSASTAKGNGDLSPALEQDAKTLRTRLQQWVQDPVIQEALFVASPHVQERTVKWPALEGAKGRDLECTLAKYFGRMASRCTPFGLFSGCSVGSIGSETRLELEPRDSYGRHTRPDMNFLTALVDGLNRDEELRKELRFRPNSSLYRLGDRIQYAEARLERRLRSYFLVSAAADEALATVLACASHWATLDELAAVLVGPDVDLEEAADYVRQLVDAQILVPELAPALTGPEALEDVLLQLRDKRAAAKAHETLARLQTALQALDATGLGAAPNRYREIADSLRGLPADADVTRLFQVDMAKPVHRMELGAEVVEDLLAGIDVLHVLFGGTNRDGLQDFRRAFRERYEDREVPLVEVLDEEAGIGFRASHAPGSDTSPLLADIQFPIRPLEQTVPVNATTHLLQRKLFETIAAGLDEMVLSEKDLAPLRSQPQAPLPDAFEIMCSLLPPDPDNQADRRHRLLIAGLSGPSGARLLGRFCHADPKLKAEVERHLADEEALKPDASFFEIVHLPEGRMGNIIARPVLRTYELAFLGRSGASAEHQMAVTDLTVSLEHDRVVLRSRSLDREVIPRLTAAHNTELRTVGVYRFLAALQAQGVTPHLAWNWGSLRDLPFLPRVRCGRVFLAPRTWTVSHEEVQEISKGDAASSYRAVQEWRRARRLPRHIGLADNDNVLPVDLENWVSIDAFLDLVGKRPQLTLREMLPGPNELVVEGPEGRFCHEIIVPFTRNPSAANGHHTLGNAPAKVPLESAKGSALDRSGPPSIPRLRAPGSDWMYLKVYCGPATGDRMLREVVSPLVDEMVAAGLARKWFFIRYADPSAHLRVRFQGEPNSLISKILPAAETMLRPFLESGLAWKLQIDSYEREIRRYGGRSTMELCESVFQADSDAVREIVGVVVGDGGADDRWRLTLDGIDRYLEDFGFDLTDKFQLMHGCAESAATEFGLVKGYKELVLRRYRRERKSIEELLDRTAPRRSESPATAALQLRSTRVKPIAMELRRIAKTGHIESPLSQIVQSMIHMHVNRMARGNATALEAILYQFLDRHYDSQLARRGLKGSRRELAKLQL